MEVRMADRPARKPRQLHRGRVERVERLTPHMIRVVLGGDGLAAFGAGDFTDHYIKILFPVDGVDYGPGPFDPERARAEFPREQWPVQRTYTVRGWDAGTRELSVDFVHHGDEGVAGPWAANAQPGDELVFGGPGGAYAPAEDADWHLLAGDESALPAIATALERLPAGARAYAFVEVDGEADEQKIETAADAEIVWLHRDGAPVGSGLVRAVSGLEFPAGDVHAFVHGEAGFVKELRRVLRVERGVARERLSISGYWRLGHDEDGWQSSKRVWNEQVEAEQESAQAS
jgi:NADPH-dependent ferric siderophore reductase